MSIQATATALQGGRVTPARQVRLAAPPGGPGRSSAGTADPRFLDVDECSTGGAGCPQRCVNTAGSYRCQCWAGHSPTADGTLCLPKGGPPRVAPGPTTGELTPTLTAGPGLGQWAGRWASPYGCARPGCTEVSQCWTGSAPHGEDGAQCAGLGGGSGGWKEQGLPQAPGRPCGEVPGPRLAER